MRFLFYVGSVLLWLGVGVYVLAFTSIGNSFVKPKVEAKINEQLHIDAKLSKFEIRFDRFNIILNLDANNKVELDGTYSLFSQTLDVNYNVELDKLETLKTLTKADLRGVFHTSGNVKGDMAYIKVDGKSDLASSITNYMVEVKNLKPDNAKLTIKDMQLAQVLYMVEQPHYTDGKFSLDATITNLKLNNLKGEITSYIKDGLLDSAYLSKTYEFKSKMPKTTYNLKTYTTLDGTMVDTNIKLNSTLAKLEIKSAKFNIADSSIISDYKTTIKSFNKLFFVTQRKMRGGITINGELKKAKDLDLSIYTNIAGGKIDAKLHNDEFKANLKSVQTLKMLHILIYPEIFKASLNAKVDYNLKSQKGNFSGHLVKGTFIKNEMITLVKKYARVDLYREIFSGDVDAKINKEKILASLDLKSRQASIVTKNTKLDTKKQTIDSKVSMQIKKNHINVTLKGKIDSPKIGLDAKAIIKDKIKDRLTKEIEKKAGKEVKNILKSFF